jgi:hypothetical protein
MANLNKTKLDSSQCIVGAYDGVEEANRVIIAAATEFAVELSAADGDSVVAYAGVSDSSTSSNQTPASISGDVLLTISDVSKYSKLQIYSEALAGVSVAGTVFVQGSPDSAGSFWANLGSAVSSPSSPGISASSVAEFVAKRIRLVSNVAPTGGNVQYKVIFKS